MVNRSGQALVEYVVILLAVAITLISALTVLKVAAGNTLNGTAETVEECATPGQGGSNPGHGGGTPRGQCLKAN